MRFSGPLCSSLLAYLDDDLVLDRPGIVLVCRTLPNGIDGHRAFPSIRTSHAMKLGSATKLISMSCAGPSIRGPLHR